MREVLILTATLAVVALGSCQKSDTPQTGIEPKTVFVATDRHDVGLGNNLKALVQMTSQNQSIQRPSIYFIGGDNVGKGSMKDSLAMPGYYLEQVRSEIAAGAGSDDFTFVSTYGSHDGGCFNSYTDFFSGPRSCGGLYLYGISYAQMCYAADSSAVDYTGLDAYDSFGVSAESASARFLRWIDCLDDANPIIIMSHVPIHANRNDNPGGKIWADAINEASTRHEIFLLFGHNHTSEEMGPMSPMPQNDGQGMDEGPVPSSPQQTVNEQDYYFVPAGSTLPVQTADKDVADTLTISFTYMNAGYIKLGYASTITFADDDCNGVYDRYCIRRHTVNDTIITHFGSTEVPNPVILQSSWGD